MDAFEIARANIVDEQACAADVAARCTYTNSGAPLQRGGSDTYQSIFQNDPGTPPVTPPVVTPPVVTPPVVIPSTGADGSTNVTGGNYIGCLSSTARDGTPLFKGAVYQSSELTQEACLLLCNAPLQNGQDLGGPFKFFAMENSNICRCANSYAFGQGTPLGDDQCAQRAAGNPLEAGGDEIRYSAFQNSAYVIRPDFSALSSKLCSANVKMRDAG